MSPPAKKPPAKKKPRYVERPNVREKLLDAAEFVFREEGYGAATVRRIASQAGMTHQAVFYYFGSQEELLLSLLQRSAESYLKRMEEALSSESPLRGLWDIVSDPHMTRLGLEFMAFANHNEAIRDRMAVNTEQIRAFEVKGIEKHLEARGIKPRLSPQLATIFTNALARLLVQEANLGIHAGHEEAEALIDRSLRNFEALGEFSSEVR